MLASAAEVIANPNRRQHVGNRDKWSGKECQIMSEQDSITVVQKAYNNFKEGNIQGLLDLMPDNVTWQLPEIEGVPFAGKRSGRGSVRELFVVVGTNLAAFEFDALEFV